jgi:Tol biopolymer transport system component
VVGVGCDGAGTPAPDAGSTFAPYRPPTLTAIRPAEVSLAGPAFVMELDGAFDPDAVVLLDGSALTTRRISEAALEADVPAEVLEEPGRRHVQVLHAEAGGGLSAMRPLVVLEGVAGPVLDQLVPDRLFVGNPSAMILIDGWNFTPASVGRWQGMDRVTTYMASNRIGVTLLASDLAAVGSANVTVVTPGGPASSALAFTIEDRPMNQIGVLARVSVSSAGAEGNGDSSGAAMSADGRYVAFTSFADTLVATDSNAQRDVFVRDTCLGATSCTPTTIRASQSMAGGDPNGQSYDIAISGTGRYVAFISSASNLVAGDTGDYDVFWRDTCLGATSCTPATLEVTSTGYTTVNKPRISGDGRFVAFSAFLTGIGEQIYRFDTCLGATSCTPSTMRISETNGGVAGDRSSDYPALSHTGRYVAFQSRALNLDGGPVANGGAHVYIVDTCFGATSCTRSITRATVAADGTSEADGFATNVSITPNGRFIGFTTWGTNLTTETFPSFSFQVFFRDTCIGATSCMPSTVMVSKLGNTAPNDDSHGPAITPDGRYVAFMSRATDLVVNDTNGRDDIYVRDLCTGIASGCTPTTRRVSTHLDTTQSNGHSGDQDLGPWISTDGSITSFASHATNLVANDTNGASDVFVAGTGFPQ